MSMMFVNPLAYGVGVPPSGRHSVDVGGASQEWKAGELPDVEESIRASHDARRDRLDVVAPMVRFGKHGERGDGAIGGRHLVQGVAARIGIERS